MKTIRFQNWILASAGLMVITFSTIFVSTVFDRFNAAARQGATEKFELITGRIGEQLEKSLESQTSRAAILAQSNIAGLTKRQAIKLTDAQDLLRAALVQFPSVLSEFIALPNGDYLQVIAVGKNPQIAQTLRAPELTQIAQRLIQTDAKGARVETWQFLGQENAVLGERSLTSTDVPTQSPWYKGALQAKGVFVTQPYTLAPSQLTGLTVASAMPDGSGVYGMDISLADLPAQLASANTSENAFLAVLDAQGRVIGSSKHGSAPSVSQASPLPILSQLSDARLQALGTALGASSVNRSQLTQIDGQMYLIATKDITLRAGQQYKVLAFAPESDFLAVVSQAKEFVWIITGLLLLLLIPLANVATRGIARSLTDMSADADRLRKLDFSSEPHPVQSRLYEINELAQAAAATYQAIRNRTAELETAQAKLSQIVETGVELGREKNRDKLLKRALFGVREIVNCEAATLFLKTNHNTLRFAVRTNDDELPTVELPLFDAQGLPLHRFAATHVVLTGETVVIDDVYSETRFDVSGTKKFSEESGMRVVSMLNVPLMPEQGIVIGALQLMNAKDLQTGEIIAFDPELVGFVEALAAQASVALENKSLLDAQSALLDSMIQIMAGAIDTKSPYTGGHCERVPELATMLAQEACKVDQGPLADFSFKNEDEWREFKIGAWLHDCGKVTTPEYVVDKATKLETIFNRVHEVRMRFEVLLRDADIERLKAIYERGENQEQANTAFAARRTALIDDFSFVAECNLGSEFMAPDKIARLNTIARQTWLRHFDDRLGMSQDELLRAGREHQAKLPATEMLLADKPRHLFDRPISNALSERHGFKITIPEYLYNHGELYNLGIDRGTLTSEERFKINEHIIQTIVMLESMPLPANLKRVPEYAGTHHETLTGSGYPRNLEAKDLSVPSRIMAIADIFEALTASDRPYKKTKTLSESIKILSFFKKNGHIDADLFDLFLSSGVYKIYAAKFLLPEQIDAVDVTQYIGDPSELQWTPRTER